MATKPTSPQDTTGRAAEQAAKARAAELSARQDEISLSRQLEAESLANDIFDPQTPDQPILIDEVVEVGVALNEDRVVIRTLADIEQMTFGVVNGTPQEYNFKAGVRYTVPRHLANYLQGLGYLWLA